MTPQSRATRARHIVVNADDFGISPQVNGGILQAFEEGLISSATIMTNMPAFEDACELARQHKLQRRIGLHLNFTSGQPMTEDIAACRRFCDASGCWRPRQRVLWTSAREARALEAEIHAQVLACQDRGIQLTHLDSHHHMHIEWGMAPLVVRAAQRHGIRAVRLAPNCGPGRKGASTTHHVLADVYHGAHNMFLRRHGLAKTEYFGSPSDTARILQTTDRNVEVMVHPTLDEGGRLIDAEGEALHAIVVRLGIVPGTLSGYAVL